MCFVAPPDMAASSLPDPMDPTVHKEDVPGGLFAATLLPGEPSRDRATQAAALLRLRVASRHRAAAMMATTTGRKPSNRAATQRVSP